MKDKILQSIPKVCSHIKGFSIIEAVMATSVFGLLITALAGAFVYGQQSTMLAGNRARAVYLADECIQAVRNIRDADFANLTDGVHGLATTSNQWILTGEQNNIDIYTRSATISTVDADRKEVKCLVTWQQNKQRDGNVELMTYLTNWQEVVSGVDKCDIYCQDQGYDTGTCRQNENQCIANGETYESDGDTYCTALPQNTKCCCYMEPVIDTCAAYCQGQGYSTGTCRANTNQCTRNGETYESGGDTYCSGGGSDTCCCLP